MANNRLYIHNKKTGAKIMLAKALGCGWYESSGFDKDKLFEWLNDNDSGGFGLCTPTDLEFKTEADDGF